MTRPILITLTAPSCAGKSYLFNYIRDEAKLPCLISTTTRKPRAGEKEGIDYFFISEEESIMLGAMDQFAELAIFNGTRYGVTRKEFQTKLSMGMAFLIVEPSGIDHYVKPALDMGAGHLKYYVHTDPEVRFERFKNRVEQDLSKALSQCSDADVYNCSCKIVKTALSRFQVMLTTEMQWGTAAKWDRILFGESDPKENVEIILSDVKKLFKKLNEE
jgi:guanylate kinase